jgi:hypothetical protein
MMLWNMRRCYKWKELKPLLFRQILLKPSSKSITSIIMTQLCGWQALYHKGLRLVLRSASVESLEDFGIEWDSHQQEFWSVTEAPALFQDITLYQPVAP